MNIHFEKYQGTGNDFIMIDNRNLLFPKENKALIESLCHRRFGIGADGLILLENNDKTEVDFTMVYFNSDGNESTMCGNGGRCLVAFAHSLGVFTDETVFEAIDGLHDAIIEEDKIHLKMKDVSDVELLSMEDCFLDTGSPHFVKLVEQFPSNFVKEAATIRNSERFKKEGVNVNFVIPFEGGLHIRTYERGVEDETYSCGTGAVAAALSHPILSDKNRIQVKTLGGELEVSFDKNSENNYTNIWLIGPAVKVFEGNVKLW